MKFKTKLISAFAAAAMLASFGAAVYAEGENVAAVNGTDYQTLQAAINAAAENAEIDLTADTKEDITIGTGKNVTIDLNGYKITNDKEHTITNKGTLTVKDDSAAKTGTVDSVVNGKAAVYNETGATATLESGTYERSEEAGTEDGPNGNSHYTINNQGTMTINNAVVNNNGGHSSNIINGGFEEGAKLIIEGATVTGGVIAVKNDEYGSTLTIKSGTFSTDKSADCVVVQNSGVAIIEGGTFTGNGGYVIYTTKAGSVQTGECKTNISGGEFKAEGKAAVFKVDKECALNIADGTIIPAEDGTIFPTTSVGTTNFTGGKFTASSNALSNVLKLNKIAGNHAIIKDESGDYCKVISKSDDFPGSDYAAKIGSFYAKTINEAVNISYNNDEIRILKDVTEDVVIPPDKYVKVRLDGHKLTNDSDHTITNYGKLQIQLGDGTIDNVTHGKAAVYNKPGATANLNGGTYTRSEEKGTYYPYQPGGNSWYYIVNDGTMTMAYKITVKSNGGYSSLIKNGVNNDNAALTIKGGTFSGGANVLKNDSGKVTISGGTFKNANAETVILNWADIEITNGSFEATDCTANMILGAGTVTITGGDFTKTGTTEDLIRPFGPYTDSEGEHYDYIGDANISGGTFSSDVLEYLADGCAMSTGETYTVLDPKNDTGTVISGTYKSAVKNDKYEQLQIFENVTIPETGEVSFNISNTTDSVTKSFKYANVESNAKIGLIITEIPVGVKVTTTLDGNAQ